ncbi:hypothetical protein F511_01461 [Dorcoceras hygrometricum]|uniref:Myb/SANT-like domain-containing protein n=1 Tax=Dorcoceras hygrometricum TaxID=472368 RepID=A0A2Z7BFB7_9LAMI|nr:hypothetical protein F511_01461 [Dorcoceras hygrometricum]
MESGETCGSVIGQVKKGDKTRRTWSAREEEVLITALKDVITKGWKSENGFKAGYLTLLESAMHSAIPGTDLRGNPHINSKVHVWKKTYGTLVTLLGKSGVGWNDTEKTVEATDETWDVIIKVNITSIYYSVFYVSFHNPMLSKQTDSTFRSMRHKQWTHYADWCEIFGSDRATGEHSQTFQNALIDVPKLNDDVPNQFQFGDTDACNTSVAEDDSVSETHTPSSKPNVATTSKKRKRKQLNEVDDAIVAAINNLADITKVTMNDLVKQLAAPDILSDAQDVVLEALRGMNELSEDEQVIAAQLLFNNHNNLALFKRLDARGKLSLVRRLLRSE